LRFLPVLAELRILLAGLGQPYPALNDLLAGETDYMFDSATSIPHVKASKLRALAVVGPNRIPALSEVATFKELGINGMEAARGY